MPGTRRTRTTASLRRPTVWIGRSMKTGSRGSRAGGASVSVSATTSASLGSLSGLRGLGGLCGLDLGGFGGLGRVVCLGHWLTCLISNGIGCWAVCGCSGPT